MNSTSKLLVPGIAGLAVVVGLAGGSMINSSMASADTASTTVATTTADTTASTAAADVTPAAQTQKDPSQGGHVSQNGTTETLLTGDTATKATAAALAAVPGGTVQRVETDAEGAAYEAHMLKADGTSVTVKLDSSFNATSTEAGR
jgi:uncharacterized membrane protein YkoI